MTPTPLISVVFWGHACVGIHVDGAPFLLIDPYDPAGLGGVPGPPVIPTAYPYQTSTHDHVDHAAFHTHPTATVVGVPGVVGPLTLSYRLAAHDEFGGRLRGGSTRLLDIQAGGVRIVHAGDLGERPVGPLMHWLQEPRCDLLILPAGGYFTLDADGASALAFEACPHHVLFCHTADDGLALAQMDARATVQRRVREWPTSHATTLDVTPTVGGSSTGGTTVIWLTRPDGRAFLT